MNEPLQLGEYSFDSRLFMGTGKFSNSEIMQEAIKASGSQLVTVALRRFNKDLSEDDLLSPLLSMDSVTLMPNTSGARDAQEAVKAARISRDLSDSPFVKVEIHPNPHHLLPDPIETFEACKILAKENFVVMPYIPADPVLAKRLEEVGCASIMPLGAPIGSGQGLASGEMIKIIVRESCVPVVVDAGIRSPSDAAAAMEMGCDAVLVNSAVAAACKPAEMAAAFSQAVTAGRKGYSAGLMPKGEAAIGTSPLTDFLSE